MYSVDIQVVGSRYHANAVDRQLVATGRERPVTNLNEVMMMKCFDSFH